MKTETNRKIKKQNTMKTRILTLTGMVLLMTATMVNANNQSVQNSSAASGHENATMKESRNFSVLLSLGMTISLEEWISGRESWEQEGSGMTAAPAFSGSVSLEEWVISRDNWEQEGQGLVLAPTALKSISLEKWVTSRDSWEQESQETNYNLTVEDLAGMEEWMAELANWEQK
jgi:hypothetical protein